MGPQLFIWGELRLEIHVCRFLGNVCMADYLKANIYGIMCHFTDLFPYKNECAS